ncbi:MAG: Caspase family protein [Cyanobacteriota bacterium erpe_2018_sw_21hr_WHONDRS-SW48-000092_B_bin.40]|nr:Caspase family protein [Cyanobacteriota bacterium erpe_2018_sw_21hr_WHONDRS-SW48-000092_B_bin.40]
MAFGTRRNLATRTVVYGTLCAIACCISGQSPFVQAALAQSTDGTTPTQLTSNQIDGEAEASGQSYYYTFTGGPGDLTIKLDGETDFYSTNAHVVLHDERGVELGKVALNATGNSASKSATIHLTKSQVIKMQIMLGVNVGIHLKYKVSLAGPLNLQAYPTRLASRESNLQLASVNVEPAQSISASDSASGSRYGSGYGAASGSESKSNFNTDSISISNSNRDSDSSSNSAAINAPIEDKWAFVVGVSKFAKPSINLKYPAKDAKDLSNYLINEANFAPDHVKLLVDEQATKERVLAELGDKWLPRLAHPNDLVLIFISTHGSPSQADLEGLNYLVMHNTDPDSLYATGLPLSDLAAAIKQRVHSNRVVLIIDACHSGAADTAKGLTRVGNIDSAALSQGTGQLIICSSMPNQVSWESKRYQNGVFTHQLIEALRAGKPTLSQAFERLKESVQTEVLQDRSELQTAVLKSKWKGNDLIISAPPTKPRQLPAEFKLQ